MAESLIWNWKFDTKKKRNILGYTHNLTSIQGLLSAFRTFPALDLVPILQAHPRSVCAEMQARTAHLRSIPVLYTKCHFSSKLCRATCYWSFRRWKKWLECLFFFFPWLSSEMFSSISSLKIWYRIFLHIYMRSVPVQPFNNHFHLKIFQLLPLFFSLFETC